MGYFIGLFLGSAITVFLMSLLRVASDADDVLLGDDQYNEK